MSSPSDPTTEAMQQRGLLGVVVLVVPIVSIVVVGAAYLGLAWMGLQGRDEAGTAVRMAFRGCPAAQEGVAARVAFMGLPDPRFETLEDGFALTTALPPDPEVRASIPVTLSAPGVLVVRPEQGGEAVLTRRDIASATVELPFLDAPHAILALSPDGALALQGHMEGHPEDAIAVELDGEVVYKRKNSPSVSGGRLAVDQPGETDLNRMRFAAHLAAVLQGPALPCQPTVVVDALDEG